MKAILALEDGTWYEGNAAGATGAVGYDSGRDFAAIHAVSESGDRFRGDRSRRGGLQHQHDGVSGNPDRPFVCRTDRDDDLPADSATTASHRPMSNRPDREWPAS